MDLIAIADALEHLKAARTSARLAGASGRRVAGRRLDRPRDQKRRGCGCPHETAICRGGEMKQQTVAAVATFFIATVSIGFALIVTRPVIEPAAPDCWARSDKTGAVIQTFNSGRCVWQPGRPPTVHFNYAPLTDEQRAAYAK
jgi:hypothetical protein